MHTQPESERRCDRCDGELEATQPDYHRYCMPCFYVLRGWRPKQPGTVVYVDFRNRERRGDLPPAA